MIWFSTSRKESNAFIQDRSQNTMSTKFCWEKEEWTKLQIKLSFIRENPGDIWTAHLRLLHFFLWGGGLLVFQSGLRIWGTQRMPTAYSYAFFFVKISQYSRFYKLIICKISNRSVSLRLLKIFYSPFEVKQSKLCHYIDCSSSIFQFIIMWTFQTSNKSNFVMSFWMIRGNLLAIKQLVEMAFK